MESLLYTATTEMFGSIGKNNWDIVHSMYVIGKTALNDFMREFL